MANHHDSHGSYYVPSYSWWPILAAIALFLLGVGSINYFGADASAAHFLLAGLILLILVAFGWFRSVIRESNAGLYDAQMKRTFVQGMQWFLFTDFMLLACLLGTLWYCRLLNITQLAGHTRIITHLLLWPNFVASWPQIQTPDPTQFTPAHQGLVITARSIIATVVMIASSFTLWFAHRGLRHNKRWALNTGLFLTVILGVVFVISKIMGLYIAATEYQLLPSSGIYGSILWMTMVLFLLNVIVGILMLLISTLRSFAGAFSTQNDFSVRAFGWFWNLLVIAWIAIFFSIY